MPELNLDVLLEAARPGGPAALGAVGYLQPIAGSQALVAPAKYAKGKDAVYVYEDRFIDGELCKTVLIDSRSSAANRMEEALRQAIRDGNSVLTQMPHITVTYQTEGAPSRVFYDYTLPHRSWDSHVRLGAVGGIPVTDLPEYVAARNATADDAWPLFCLSPITVLLGGWDSSRRTNQSRFPAAITGEIIGVVGNEKEHAQPTKRSGARIDPLGASIQVDAEVAKELAKNQADEMSPKLVGKINKQKGTVSASNLGLGAIPPGTATLDGIATSDIIRSYSLSFSTLRRLHFGKGPEGDAAIRALLAAIGIAAMVRNDAESFIRANCHLVESGPTQLRLDRRQGNFDDLSPLSVAETDALLAQAYENAARAAGVDWHGQNLAVIGNPAVAKGAEANEDDGEK